MRLSTELLGGFTSTLLVGLAFSQAAQAQTIEVLYCKSDASPTSDIPGTLDLGGLPAASKWRAIEDFTVSHDGTQWVVKGRTRLGSDLESILVLGHGASGTQHAINLAQEGQPIPNDVTGNLWDFFDSGTPVSFDAYNNIGMSARSKGGATGTLERVLKRRGDGTWSVVLREGDPLVGTTDTPGSEGDEALGNSVSGVFLRNSGEVEYIVTPIQNCSSVFYPGRFRDANMVMQSGFSSVDGGAELWDSMDLGDAGGTPDGMHWWMQGDTDAATTSDDVFVVDGVVVLREGLAVDGGAGPLYTDAFQAQMAEDGSWIVRGDDPNNDDWVVFNGALIAQTGGPVAGGAENWGVSISAVACNAQGDWVIVGNTDNADPASDEVLVVNGQVLVREGDPVDLDGNGLLDDDAYIGRGANTSTAFAANDVAITPDGTVYFIANLHNFAGVDLNDAAFGTPDAFMRVKAPTTPGPLVTCTGDGNPSSTACPCGNTGALRHGCANSANVDGAELSTTGSVSVASDDLVLLGTGMVGNLPVLYFQGDNLPTTAGTPDTMGTVFGDGLRCAGQNVIRLGVKFNTAGASQYPQMGDASIATKGLASPGQTKYYQAWYRDPSGVCGNVFNLSNGLVVHWTL